MPSIKDLFAKPDEEGEAPDLSELLGGRFAVAEVEEQDEPVLPVDEIDPDPVVEETPDPDVIIPKPVTDDVLAQMPADRRALILSISEALDSDPSAAARIVRGLSAPEEEEYAAPSLPDDIIPGTVEARLWEENQEIRHQLDELTGSVNQQSQMTAQQRAQEGARVAVMSFKSKHPTLEDADITAIVRQSADTGLAGAFATSNEFAGNLSGAYEKALETTLWSNESFRSKVVGEMTPVVVPIDPDAEKRKRVLNSLSSAASPVASAPVVPKPLETREDGRLTPESRQRAIQSVMTQIAASGRP